MIWLLPWKCSNLDSVLESRDITLLTKINIVKTMIFPVVMYGCEAVHKSTKELIAFELWCCRRLLRVLWTEKRSNQSFLKEINHQHPLEGLTLKPQYFRHLIKRAKLMEKGPDAGKGWRQKEKGAAEDEMAGWHHWLNEHESELTPGDSEGQGSLVCCSPWGHRVGHDWAAEHHPEKAYHIGENRKLQQILICVI